MGDTFTRRASLALMTAGLSWLFYLTRGVLMPARREAAPSRKEDAEIVEILDLISGIDRRWYLCEDADSGVVVWHDSREPHPSLKPTREMVKRMHAEGWIRDREAKGPHPLDFKFLYRYYVTAKGYAHLLASQGLT